MSIAPAEVVTSTDGDVEYQRGTLPFIVTAPHGGDRRPDAIADRTEGELLNDARTQELARFVAAALTADGQRPHVVINRLHRIKLDANRPIEDATAGDARAEAAWTAYHDFIDQARAEVLARHERGLLVDIHGHSHDVDWVELGYLVTSKKLALDDAAIEEFGAESSMRNLVASAPSSFAELLRGPSSLGAELEREGYAAVPSPSHPSPKGSPYFSGGYTLRRHGPGQGEAIDAVQIEAHKEGVRDTKLNRVTFATVLASSLRRVFSLP